MADDKQQAVLDAAQAQFLRYGFRRVTMADIASAASMSRPALYLLFPNKEAIFAGVLERFLDAALAEIEAGVNDFDTPADQLSFAAEVWTIRTFALLEDSPDARELTDCTLEFAAELMERSFRRFEAILRGIFSPHEKALQARKLDATTLAEMFAASLHGIKTSARDLAHVRALVAELIGITTAALDTGRAGRSTTRRQPARQKRSSS